MQALTKAAFFFFAALALAGLAALFAGVAMGFPGVPAEVQQVRGEVFALAVFSFIPGGLGATFLAEVLH